MCRHVLLIQAGIEHKKFDAESEIGGIVLLLPGDAMVHDDNDDRKGAARLDCDAAVGCRVNGVKG